MKVLIQICACFVFATAFLSPAQKPKPTPTNRAALIDINRATSAELRALPGMGAAYVARIIAGRPYTAKNQLVSRGILPESAYDKIQPLIVARQRR